MKSWNISSHSLAHSIVRTPCLTELTLWASLAPKYKTKRCLQCWAQKVAVLSPKRLNSRNLEWVKMYFVLL